MIPGNIQCCVSIPNTNPDVKEELDQELKVELLLAVVALPIVVSV